MNYEAPFLTSSKEKRSQHPVAGLAVFLALLFVPVLVAALAFGQWCCSVLISVIAAFVLIALCLVSLFSARFVRRFPLWTKPLTRLIVLLVGIILLMTPVALYGGVYARSLSDSVPKEHPVITMLGAIYSAIKTIGLDMTPAEWTANEKITEGLPAWLLFSHAFFLIVYAIACPLSAVFAAFDAVVNGVAGARIWFWSWRKSHSSTKAEIYVFHELDEHGSTLAHSIMRARDKELPLIIFANVGDLEASRDETLMEDLLDQATGRAFVLFTSLPAQSIPGKLCKRALRTCTIRYFAISENSTTNMQTAVQLWDAIFEQLWNETWRIDRKHLPRPKDDNYAVRCKSIADAMKLQAMSSAARALATTKLGFDPAAFDAVMELGKRVSIHCLHSHPDDSAILDNLANRSAEHIASRISKEYAKPQDASPKDGEPQDLDDGTTPQVAEPQDLDDGTTPQGAEPQDGGANPKDNKSPKTLTNGVQELAERLRSLVEVRLLSQPQLAIYDLFDKHPLYESLDPINLQDLVNAKNGGGGLSEQTLTVLILGCGTYGTEALKAAFWLGRFAGTRLKIVVVERDNVRQKMEQLLLDCPGLVTERTYTENPQGPLNGTWSITERHDVRTVRFCQADVFGASMRSLVGGQCVQALWYELDEHGTPGIVERSVQLIENNDHLYCLVCLNDDDTTLNAALDLQRNLAIRKLRAKSAAGAGLPVAGKEGTHVPIALRVRSDLTLSSGELGENGLQSDLYALGFPLYPFGSLSSTFTHETIANDKIEQHAIQTNVAYNNAHYQYPSFRLARMGYYGLTEVKRMSNRSSALSIPYKLWMLGMDKDVDVESFLKAIGRDSRPQTDDFFRESLMLPKVLNGVAKEVSEEDKMRIMHADGEFRRRFPLFAYLADLEHVRWCAFYRSLGWRDALSVLDDKNADLMREGLESEQVVSNLEELKKVRKHLTLEKGRQHTDLKLHYYLCDNIGELGKRGEDCFDHPFAYDRIIVWLSANILACTVCTDDKEH